MLQFQANSQLFSTRYSWMQWGKVIPKRFEWKDATKVGTIAENMDLLGKKPLTFFFKNILI